MECKSSFKDRICVKSVKFYSICNWKRRSTEDDVEKTDKEIGGCHQQCKVALLMKLGGILKSVFQKLYRFLYVPSANKTAKRAFYRLPAKMHTISSEILQGVPFNGNTNTLISKLILKSSYLHEILLFLKELTMSNL